MIFIRQVEPLHLSFLERLAHQTNLVFQEGNRLFARPLYWSVAICCVLALQTFLISSHWPWPDEYQAVQLAVQAPDISTLLAWLRYEGHPPLWYLLLYSLAHVIEPLDVLWVAALLLALPTQCLILFASPFTRIERLLLALSEFLIFDFLTISRGTTLGVMLLIFTLAVWQKRYAWVAIALLPLCDFLFGVISVLLLLLKWFEKALWIPGLFAWLVFSLMAADTVRPAPDIVSAFNVFKSHNPTVQTLAYEWLLKISGLLIPFQGGTQPGWNSPLHPVESVAWIGFLALCWFATRKQPLHCLLLFGFIGLTFVFSLLVYPLGLRHMMLIALLLILLTWRARAAGAAPVASFRLWLACAAICGVATAAISYTKSFDTARLAVAEIRERGLQDKHWMMFPDWRVSGIAALSGMRFERPEQHCMLDFVRWNYRTTLANRERLTDFLRGEIALHGRSYLVSDMAISGIPADVLQPLTTVEAGYDGVPYHLFVVGPNAAEKSVNLPDCVPGKRPLKRF